MSTGLLPGTIGITDRSLLGTIPMSKLGGGQLASDVIVTRNNISPSVISPGKVGTPFDTAQAQAREVVSFYDS
jgi:hypothetical protein